MLESCRHSAPAPQAPAHFLALIFAFAAVVAAAGLAAGCDDEATAPTDAGADSADAGSDAANDGGGGGGDLTSDTSGRQTYTGDYTVSNQREMEFIGGFTAITGSLTVRAPTITALELPRLETISGNLRISGNDALISIEAPALSLVNGDVTVTANDALEDLDGLVSLARIGGDLRVSANPGVTSLSWPALEDIGGSLALGRDTGGAEGSVERVAFEALATIDGTLQVLNSAALEALELDAVTEVGGLFVSGNPDLPALSLPALANLDGFLTVSDNDALGALALPALTRVNGTFRVTDNPALPECLVNALLGRLRIADYRGEATVEGNDERQGPCAELCGDVGGTNERGQRCMEDGNFARPCRRADCLDRERLCQEDTDAFGYNACVPPDQVTAGCPSAPEFRSSFRGGGPVIFDSELMRDEERDADCADEVEGSVAWRLTFTYEDVGGDARTPEEGSGRETVEWIRAPIPPAEEGGETIRFSPMTSPFDLEFTEGYTANEGNISLWICLTDEPADVAVRTSDRSSRASNVLCAFPVVAE